MSLEWMAWTLPTALFFLAIPLLVGAVSWLQWRHPQPARRGWLPLRTTRGDRLFLALLSAAFVHIGWLLAAPAAPVWPATLAAVLLGGLLMRSG